LTRDLDPEGYAWLPQRLPRSRAGDPVFLSFLLVTGSPAGEELLVNLVQKLGKITRSTAYSIWLQAAPEKLVKKVLDLSPISSYLRILNSEGGKI